MRVLRGVFLLTFVAGGAAAYQQSFTRASHQLSVGNGTIRPFLLVGIENTQRRRDMTGPTENEDDKKIAPRVGDPRRFGRSLATS